MNVARASAGALQLFAATGHRAMTINSIHNNPAALTAARHLQEFGFTGWHLRQGKGRRPAPGTVVDGAARVERQVVQADHYAAGDFPERDESAVFLLMGKPRPEAGDGLIALTRYWLIEQVNIVHPDNREAIYAVFCV